MEFSLLACQTRQALLGGFSQQSLHRFQQRRDVHRFLQQSARAGAQRSEELIGPRGDDDDRNKRMLGGEPFKGVPAVLHRHVQVEQHKVNRQGVGEIKRLLSVLGRNDNVAFGHEDVVQGVAHGGIVVHQQNALAATGVSR